MTDLSIPVRFNGPQPNLYGVPPAASAPYRGDGWVGDTRHGGPCNFETVTLTPHCNGTHTECLGHVTDARFSVVELLQRTLVPAQLVTLVPVSAALVSEAYAPALQPEDEVLTAEALAPHLTALPPDAEALIIRTQPNPPEKRHASYRPPPNAPFFTNDALRALDRWRDGQLTHLVVDLPSIDRMLDDGRLSNHRIWFRLPQTGHGHTPNARQDRFISELIYAPDSLPDGTYELFIGLAPWHADAAPSRLQVRPLPAL